MFDKMVQFDKCLSNKQTATLSYRRK